MDFYFHGHNFGLTNVGVKSLLHLSFELNLTLPKQYLSLSLNNLSQNVGFFFFKSRYLTLKFDAFILELLQLLFELIFNVEVIIRHFCLLGRVLIVEIVKLIHLKIEVFKCDFKWAYLLLVSLYWVDKSQLLLLKNSFLSAEALAFGVNSWKSILLADKLSLVGDPLFLNLSDLVLHLVYLLFDVVLLSLKRTSVLVLTILLFQLV